MTSEQGSVYFSNSLLDISADCYGNPHFFNLDSFAFANIPPSQNISEPHPLSPSPTNEFSPTFFSEMLLEIPSVHTVQQNALPSSSTAPGTGARLWIPGGEYSSVVVPAIPPPTPLLPFATIFPSDWVKVPQRDYDYGRRQCGFKPLKPICFSTNGCPGMNLGGALREEFTGLDGRDDPMLQSAAGMISCRLLFPGYPGDSQKIHTLNWTKIRKSITRSKLAHEIAKRLERYLNKVAEFPPDESIEDRWRIGSGFMRIDNMRLVSLISVSRGSFQPEIWVTGHSDPRVCVG